MLNALWRPFRFVMTAMSFVYFYVGGLVMSWLILPLVGRFAPPEERLRRRMRVLRRGFQSFWAVMHLPWVIRFRPWRQPCTLPAGAFVMVANHPTLVDVTAIFGAYGRVHAVVKPQLFANPATGPLLRATGQIRGSDGTLPGAARVLSETLAWLAAGEPVLIFPEGTRSPEGRLHPFKRGAFEIACRANVPVVPIFLRIAPPILAKEAPWYRTPRRPPHYSLTELPPLAPTAWDGDSQAMTAEVESLYRRLLAGESPDAAWRAVVRKRPSEAQEMVADARVGA